MKENLSRRDFFKAAPVVAVAATEVFAAPVEAAPLEAPKTVKPEAFGIVDGATAAAYFGNDLDPRSRNAALYVVKNTESDPRIEFNHAVNGARPESGTIFLKGKANASYETWFEVDSDANVHDDVEGDGKAAVVLSATAAEGALVPTKGGNIRFASSAADAAAIGDELVGKLQKIEACEQPGVSVGRVNYTAQIPC